jgi:hypothetical protein
MELGEHWREQPARTSPIPEQLTLGLSNSLAKKAGMHDDLPTERLKVAMDKRILNEFGAKILNEERYDTAIRSRRGSTHSEFAEMLFHCECDDQDCGETISMSTEEYQKVHTKTKYFVVVPSHVQLDLEEIIDSFKTYALVGKFFPRPGKV